MRNYWNALLVITAVGLSVLGCGGSTAGVAPAGAPEPERVRAAAQDSLRLEAVWRAGSPVPEGSTIRYWVTWNRNGEEVGSDTTTGLSRGVAIRRMGNGIPDTVLVTLWTLNHGVPSERASWKERIYRPASATSDTIDLGPAPPPETSIPEVSGQAEAPAPAQPIAEPAPAPAPSRVVRPPEPVAPSPRPAAAPTTEPPRSIQRVILRVMNPPASWASGDRDCPAGIRPEGPLGLVILPETPERCKPYVASYGTTPE
ncbi:MAG TPA: hypothetical protein VK845_14770 [Gemmatimonadales bacterium]|nr:hypothetical protein [Gemmatimonadales bacterium]